MSQLAFCQMELQPPVLPCGILTDTQCERGSRGTDH